MKTDIQRGFIPIVIIIIASIFAASAGAGVVLQTQGKLAPLAANISEIFTQKEEIVEELIAQQEVDVQPENQEEEITITEDDGVTEQIVQSNKETEEARKQAEEARLEAERLRLEVEQVKVAAEQELQRQQQANAETQRIAEENQQRELQAQQEQQFQETKSQLDNLLNQVNMIYQQKVAKEQEDKAQEDEYVASYCQQKEDEINSNYASRGLYSSGARISAIESLKITCPPEARSLWNAYANDEIYPFVLQLQNMQQQFQQYNQQLYSSCKEIYSNCSVYFDAAFPIDF